MANSGPVELNKGSLKRKEAGDFQKDNDYWGKILHCLSLNTSTGPDAAKT